jgi:hypothetical protein
MFLNVPFTQPDRRQCNNADAEDEERRNIRPEDGNADPFEKDAAKGTTRGRWFSGCFHLFLPVSATSVTRANARFMLDVFTPR